MQSECVDVAVGKTLGVAVEPNVIHVAVGLPAGAVGVAVGVAVRKPVGVAIGVAVGVAAGPNVSEVAVGLPVGAGAWSS